MATKSTPATRAAAAPRNRAPKKPPDTPVEEAVEQGRVWDIDKVHNLIIEYGDDSFTVRVHEVSQYEWEEAMEAGDEALAALIDEALLTSKHEFPARYGALVVKAIRDFFTEPMLSVGQDGETATDGPGASDWDDGEDPS